MLKMDKISIVRTFSLIRSQVIIIISMHENEGWTFQGLRIFFSYKHEFL